MTHPKHTEPRVTQADREAVYDLARQGMLSGTRVFEATAEAFARHRQSSEAASREEMVRLIEASSEAVNALSACGYYALAERLHEALTALRGAQ